MSPLVVKPIRTPLPSVKSSCQCTRSFHATSTHSYTSPHPDDLNWPESPNPTPYEIFNLPPTASHTEIKKRYYQLARRYHPDSHFALSDAAEQVRLQRFRQVVQANELL